MSISTEEAELKPTETYASNPLLGSIIGRLRLINTGMLRHSAIAAEQIGTTGTALLFLQEVKQHPGLRLTQVADRLCIQQASASNILRTLANQDYIEKKASDTDKRAVLLKLTERGESFLVGNFGKYSCPIIAGLDRLDNEKVKLLHELLGTIVDQVNIFNAELDTPGNCKTCEVAQS